MLYGILPLGGLKPNFTPRPNQHPSLLVRSSWCTSLITYLDTSIILKGATYDPKPTYDYPWCQGVTLTMPTSFQITRAWQNPSQCSITHMSHPISKRKYVQNIKYIGWPSRCVYETSLPEVKRDPKSHITATVIEISSLTETQDHSCDNHQPAR